MATWIKTDGSSIQITPQFGKAFTLEELHEYVGGYIEAIRLPSGSFLILNEEGKLIGLPKNERATVMGHSCGIADDDYIVGNVVIVREEEFY